jgi:2,4-dienoyl-CoA reductase-like NADH-dependent reductase (Old Yellow Enzyme family)
MLASGRKPSVSLQQPGQMGPLRLKNRVVMGPMGTNFGTTAGFSISDSQRQRSRNVEKRI